MESFDAMFRRVARETLAEYRKAQRKAAKEQSFDEARAHARAALARIHSLRADLANIERDLQAMEGSV